MTVQAIEFQGTDMTYNDLYRVPGDFLTAYVWDLTPPEPNPNDPRWVLLPAGPEKASAIAQAQALLHLEPESLRDECAIRCIEGLLAGGRYGEETSVVTKGLQIADAFINERTA